MCAITQDFVPQGRKNRPGYYMVPRYITIHDTGNPAASATAKMHASYIKSVGCESRLAGWHFTVDDVSIFQHLPLNENAWHASDGSGPGNMQSIAIEICENRLPNWPENRYRAEEAAAWLVAKLVRETPSLLKFPDCMKQHYDWNHGHPCPRVLRGRTGGWEGFLKKIESYLALSSPKYAAVAICNTDADFFAADRLVRWKHPHGNVRVLVRSHIGFADELGDVYRNGADYLYIVGGGIAGFEEVPARHRIDLSGETYFHTVDNVRRALSIVL